MRSLCLDAEFRIASLYPLSAYSAHVATTGGKRARSYLPRPWRRAFRPDGPLRARLCAPLTEPDMTEPIVGLSVAVLLGIYLVYTLLHPEKF